MSEDATESRSPCKWIERDAEGRPRCEHGWAKPGGRKASGEQAWRCIEARRISERRYARTEKRRASWLKAWHEATPRRIYFTVGGVSLRYLVPPEKKEELLHRITEFKAQQSAEADLHRRGV